MRYEIAENYIVKYATLTCVQNENVSSCTANEPDSKYTGHHDFFQLIPERYLRSDRSEERRVGKECRSRWSQYH